MVLGLAAPRSGERSEPRRAARAPPPPYGGGSNRILPPLTLEARLLLCRVLKPAEIAVLEVLIDPGLPVRQVPGFAPISGQIVQFKLRLLDPRQGSGKLAMVVRDLADQFPLSLKRCHL